MELFDAVGGMAWGACDNERYAIQQHDHKTASGLADDVRTLGRGA